VLLLWRPSRHIQHPKNEGLKGEKNKLAKILHLKSQDGDDLWEESKDDERLTPEQLAERSHQIEEYAELILAKQRNGPVNNIRLRFVDEMTRFENVTKKMWSNREDERQET
jgi:replicative DNA helicase